MCCESFVYVVGDSIVFQCVLCSMPVCSCPEDLEIPVVHGTPSLHSELRINGSVFLCPSVCLSVCLSIHIFLIRPNYKQNVKDHY